MHIDVVTRAVVLAIVVACALRPRSPPHRVSSL